MTELGSGSGARASATKVGKADTKLSDPTSALKHDYRSFECKTWQLEPTLRYALLSLDAFSHLFLLFVHYVSQTVVSACVIVVSLNLDSESQ